jgi:nucleotide-binding universal stress UspA family protein
MAHVLVPVDDSTRAREAFEFALEEHAGAEITALHVIGPTNVVSVTEPSVWDDELRERVREEAEELLKELREEANARGKSVTTEIAYGDSVPRTIIEYAGEHDVDQVVIGSHGRTGFSRVLLGSVAETVVRRAPMPVTVVR